jgi:outer membrane protein assembly factor BamB
MQQSITSLNPLTGQVYWQERLNTGQDFAVATPVYQDHRLLIGGMMFALDPDRPKAVVLWPKTRAVARRIFSNTSTAMIRNGFVYSARSEGQFLCVSAETGETVWETEQVTTQRNGASIHILELGEKTFLETDEGNLVLADLSERGYREIGRTKIIEPAFPFAGRKVAWPPPAVANQRLYIRNERELICVDLAGKD